MGTKFFIILFAVLLHVSMMEAMAKRKNNSRYKHELQKEYSKDAPSESVDDYMYLLDTLKKFSKSNIFLVPLTLDDLLMEKKEEEHPKKPLSHQHVSHKPIYSSVLEDSPIMMQQTLPNNLPIVLQLLGWSGSSSPFSLPSLPTKTPVTTTSMPDDLIVSISLNEDNIVKLKPMTNPDSDKMNTKSSDKPEEITPSNDEDVIMNEKPSATINPLKQKTTQVDGSENVEKVNSESETKKPALGQASKEVTKEIPISQEPNIVIDSVTKEPSILVTEIDPQTPSATMPNFSLDEQIVSSNVEKNVEQKPILTEEIEKIPVALDVTTIPNVLSVELLETPEQKVHEINKYVDSNSTNKFLEVTEVPEKNQHLMVFSTQISDAKSNDEEKIIASKPKPNDVDNQESIYSKPLSLFNTAKESMVLKNSQIIPMVKKPSEDKSIDITTQAALHVVTQSSVVDSNINSEIPGIQKIEKLNINLKPAQELTATEILKPDIESSSTSPIVANDGLSNSDSVLNQESLLENEKTNPTEGLQMEFFKAMQMDLTPEISSGDSSTMDRKKNPKPSRKPKPGKKPSKKPTIILVTTSTTPAPTTASTPSTTEMAELLESSSSSSVESSTQSKVISS